MTDHKYPDIANLLNEMYDRNVNREEHDRKVADEMTRQLIYGQPPSEGLPDVRPNYPRYEQYAYGSGDGSAPELIAYSTPSVIADMKRLEVDIYALRDGDIVSVKDGRMTVRRRPWYRRLLAWILRGLIRLRNRT